MKAAPGLLLLAVVCLGACAGAGSGQPAEVSVAPADPARMPTEITLYRSVPVLAVRLQATAAGYSVSASHSMGAPSAALDQSRDVLVQAIDPTGRPLQTITVDNPRAVRTTGSKNPAQALRPAGEVTVFFANPDQVGSVSVSVLRGPNEGLEQVFELDPGALKSAPGVNLINR